MPQTLTPRERYEAQCVAIVATNKVAANKPRPAKRLTRKQILDSLPDYGAVVDHPWCS